MTEEQIKQNANEYATKHESCHGGFPSFRNAFLAGAHSRDEEIEELKKQLAAMTRLKNSFAGGVDILDKDNRELQEELDKLRNPWRSVKNYEPKKDQDVFVYLPNLCGGEYCKLTYLGNYRWSQDDGEWTAEFYNNEALWMPIPQIKKGK